MPTQRWIAHLIESSGHSWRHIAANKLVLGRLLSKDLHRDRGGDQATQQEGD